MRDTTLITSKLQRHTSNNSKKKEDWKEEKTRRSDGEWSQHPTYWSKHARKVMKRQRIMAYI